MFFVQIMNIVNLEAKSEERGNNRAGARAKDDVEPLAKETVEHGFDFLENTQGVEAFCASAVESQDSAEIIGRIFLG
jgi:hypothetical protein